MFVAVLLASSGTGLAEDTPADWYRNTFIHSHISISFNNAWAEEFQSQVQAVQPDVIEFHSSNESGWPNYRLAKRLSQRLGFGLSMTINRAGSWRPEYDEDPRFVLRINADGSRAGRWGKKHLCCNAPAVDEVVIPYYARAAKDFQPEQIWVDENVITINVCYCDQCRRRFHEQHGNEPPMQPGDPHWDSWVTFHRESFTNWMRKVSEAVYHESPQTLVTFNHAYCAEQPEKPPEFIKNLSADIHRDPLAIGFYSRYCAATGLPFDIMPGLSNDKWAGSVPKALQQVLQEIAIITANGGRWNIGEFPTTGSEKGKSRPAATYLELAAEGARFARARQRWTHNTRSLATTAILHSASTQYDKVIPKPRSARDEQGDLVPNSDGAIVRNSSSEEKTRIYWPNNRPVPDSVLGAHMALVENHLHHDVINEDVLLESIDQYQCLIVAEQHKLREETVKRIAQFVRQGGTLLATGSSLESGLHEVLGCVRGKRITKASARLAISKEDSVDFSSYYRFKPSGADVLRTFSSGNIDPAVTVNNFGRGSAYFIAGDIFYHYYRRSPLSWKPRRDVAPLRTYCGDMLDHICPSRDLSVEAPAWLEVAMNEKAEETLIHLVDRSFQWKEESQEPSRVVRIKLRTEAKPASVKLQPENKPIDSKWKSGELHLEVPLEEIDTHGILVIKAE